MTLHTLEIIAAVPIGLCLIWVVWGMVTPEKWYLCRFGKYHSDIGTISDTIPQGKCVESVDYQECPKCESERKANEFFNL